MAVWQAGGMRDKDEMTKTTLRLPKKLWHALRVKALNEGKTAQDIVIEALQTHMKKGARP
jgi:hypothetical protein